MDSQERANTTIRISIATATALLLSMGGCRVGNYSNSSTPPSDPVTGYYDANPQSLTFCASASATQCKSASTASIPSFIGAELTNPAALILQDESTGRSAITAAVGGRTALPIYVLEDNTGLYFANNTEAETLWLDPSCTTTLYLKETGSIVRGTGHPVAGTTTGRTVGKLTLDVLVIRSFDGVNGSCGADLQAMSDCYQNVSHCGGSDSGVNQDRQDAVRSLFETYIQAGAMTAADIPHVTSVGYEIQYQ